MYKSEQQGGMQYVAVIVKFYNCHPFVVKSSALLPLHNMADIGHTEMADSQTKTSAKSLVSEQYLDGWPLDDDNNEEEEEEEDDDNDNNEEEDEDDDDDDEEEDRDSKLEEEKSSTSKDSSDQTNLSRSSVKRQNYDEEETTEKKRACYTFSSVDDKSDVNKPLASSRISLNLGSSKAKIVAPIKMDLSSQSKPKESHSLIKKSAAVEQAFGEDSDASEEEMPAEARMRMRNIGRETPTAAGPNSFGKGRLGFCDRQKIIERELVKKTDS